MEQTQLPHSLQLTQRQNLTLTGVTEVVSFDETTVVLRTEPGTLIVQGRDLKLRTLSEEGGRVAVDGCVAALCYQEPRQSRSWRELFR